MLRKSLGGAVHARFGIQEVKQKSASVPACTPGSWGKKLLPRKGNGGSFR